MRLPLISALRNKQPDLRARASFRAAVEQKPRAAANEIVIYDDIGIFGVTAGDVRAKLEAANGADISVLINSYGGDVYDGIAIYNQLVTYAGAVNVRIDGIAASAASLIAMAGDHIAIGENAELMIHNAWTIGWGNAADMRDIAGRLDQIDGNLAATYAARTGIDVAEVAKMMAEDTFLTGADAVAQGFADEILPLKTAEKQSESASIAALRRLADTLNRGAAA